MNRPSDESTPWLLTPGPLTTAPETRVAMMRDWGSRDPEFISLVARVRRRLADLAGGGSAVAVPIQGSGTFAIEAAIGTLVPADGKLLVVVNGAYGRRMVEIAKRQRRAVVALECAEDECPSVDAVEEMLAADSTLSHVAVVHCETTTGILNPVGEIAAAVTNIGRKLIVDAMSSFGAIPISLDRLGADAIVASANKCLEGVPGVAFAVVNEEVLANARGQAHSLALDLHDQWRGLEENGQFRFTPPTQVMAAFDAALAAHEAEGGIQARGARYMGNCRILIDGMRRLGFETVISEAVQAPIIVTFRMPRDPAFVFDVFYGALKTRGYVIYPGKVTSAETFRIGCIGAVDANVMRGLIVAVEDTMREMGVARGSA